MKVERSDSDKKKDTIPILKRKADHIIQLDWQKTTEKSLCKFIHTSPLKSIADFIEKDYYVNLHPALVNDVLSMGNSVYGIHLALTATIEAMRDVCMEAANVILCESGNPENIPKSPVSLTLLYESLDMIEITQDQLHTNDELVKRTPLQVRHILKNDMNRDWIKQYKEAKKDKINVFTVKMGPGKAKASPTTGRYLMSVLMPLVSPPFRLVPAYEVHSTPYEDLEALLRNTNAKLFAHERIAELSLKGKVNIHQEAMLMARQLQHKELESLRHLTSDQGAQLAILAHQNRELRAVIDSPTFQNTHSLQETILILTQKLKQSRNRNLSLMSAVKTKRKIEEIEEDLAQRKTGMSVISDECDDMHPFFKKRRMLNGFIKTHLTNTTTSSSYNSDDDDGNYDASLDYVSESDDDDESQ